MTLRKGQRKAIILGATAIGALMSLQAVAEETEKPAEEVTEEVVVTALRRSSTLQRTPLSIAAITGDGLSKIGATGLQDYFRAIPNLNLTQGVLGSSRISIRGINAAGEATVGLYFDETPITGPSGTTQDAGNNAADLNLFDIERVEALRGPQGTLYGSSSMAGTLRLIYKKPNSAEKEGTIETQVSSVDRGSVGYYTKGMLNVPLIRDVLAIRVAGWYEQRPGYIDNVKFGDSNINDSTSKGGRVILGFTPREDMNLTGTYIYQKSEADDAQGWYEAVGRYKTNSPLKLPFNNELKLFNLTYNWKLPSVTLTATGSYYTYDIVKSVDFSPTVNALSQVPSYCAAYFAQSSACTTTQLSSYRNAGLSVLPAILYQPADLESRNFEVRASSSTSGPLQWTIGAYYEERQDHIDSHVSQADPATGLVYMPLNDISYRYVASSVKQEALFGEVSYNPIDPLTITIGARHYDYEKMTEGQAFKASPLTASALVGYSKVTAKAKGWIQKYNINYKFSPTVLAYVSASQGFRPGGANNIPNLAAGLVVYQPDSLWNYETGIKSSWFDNRLTVNASVYQIDWKDMQISATTADGAFGIITNAGAARIKGGELETTWRPIRGLTLTAAGGYSDAKLTEDQANSSLQLTGTTGRTGDRLPNVPRFTGSTSAAYTWPAFDDFNGLVRADYAYTGKMQTTLRVTNPYYEVYGDYGSVNIRAGVENAKYEFAVYVQNLTNEIGLTGAISSLGVKRQVFSVAPRTIGINTRMKF